MWENHFARAEERMLTTVSFRIGQERTYKIPPCPAALGSKSTMHKIVKVPQPFHDEGLVPLLETLT